MSTYQSNHQLARLGSKTGVANIATDFMYNACKLLLWIRCMERDQRQPGLGDAMGNDYVSVIAKFFC